MTKGNYADAVKESRRCRFHGGSFDLSPNEKINMQYMMMVYMDEQRWADLPKEAQNRVHHDCAAWHQELVKSGHARAAVGLHPASTATTLREKNGKVVIADGPFAETKEVLGGYETVECKDLDEAIGIAKRFPALRVGLSMEVRPVMSDDEVQRMMPG